MFYCEKNENLTHSTYILEENHMKEMKNNRSDDGNLKRREKNEIK